MIFLAKYVLFIKADLMYYGVYILFTFVDFTS